MSNIASKILNPKVLAALALVGLMIYVSLEWFSVPLQTIQLPAEQVDVGPFSLPNTFIGTLLSDLTILVLAYFATRNMSDVPSGLQNVVEWVIEGFYNLTEDIAGDRARKFFPWIMTIFLLVLVANWWELIPGYDSIGWLESHTAPGSEEQALTHYEVRSLFPGVSTIVNEPYTPAAEAVHEAHDAHKLPVNPETGNQVAVVVPFLRAAATDLNFTLALAITIMVMVQIFGVQALGAGEYFSRFLNFKAGVMGFIVGLIETVSEVAKIISFSFRLFGNIFAGQVLLFVMPFLIPWLVPVPFFGLELFVGFIQAFVFAMLALVFFSGAVISHDEH